LPKSVDKRHKGILPASPKIVFMGTPDFSVPAFNALMEHGHNVLAVVTQPDRPRGRGRHVAFSPVKSAAEKYRLDILQPEDASDQQFVDILRRKAPDLIVVVAFGRILKKDFLEIPHWGALNIHASLLPKYRGAAPIQWAILNGENKTGLTAMRMDEGLDTGPILHQEKVPVLEDETAGRLYDRLAGLSGEFLIKTLDNLAKNRLNNRPQDESQATYAPKIGGSMSMVKWDQPAQVISALIHGLDPWPGSFTIVRGKKIKLFSSRVVEHDHEGRMPGMVLGQSQGALKVETVKGLLLIGELQAPGKRRLAAVDFLRGFPLKKGTVLGGAA